MMNDTEAEATIKLFYVELWEWVVNGCKLNPNFNRNAAVCQCFMNWMHARWYDVEQRVNLNDILIKQFTSAGLHVAFPFNNGKAYEYCNEEAWKNSKRICWVAYRANGLPIMSFELQQFYFDIAAWIVTKFNVHDSIFNTDTGLCGNLESWTIKHALSDNEYERLDIELFKSFINAGLNKNFPFNDGTEYGMFCSEKFKYDNEYRVDWVMKRALGDQAINQLSQVLLRCN